MEAKQVAEQDAERAKFVVMKAEQVGGESDANHVHLGPYGDRAPCHMYVLNECRDSERIGMGMAITRGWVEWYSNSVTSPGRVGIQMVPSTDQSVLASAQRSHSCYHAILLADAVAIQGRP